MAVVITEKENLIVEEIKDITSSGHSVTVVCDGDYEMAGDFLIELKEQEKSAREFFAPMVRAAHQAHKEVKARENEVVRPLIEARKAVGAVMGRYQQKLEEERKQELEIARVAEQKAAQAEAEKYAENLEWQGLHDYAEAARNNVPAVEPTVESVAPKVGGTSVRTTWKYEIVDESEIPREFLCVDDKAIGAMVRAKKGQVSIPGVRIWSETNVS